MDDGSKLRVQCKKQSKRNDIAILQHLEAADSKWNHKCQIVVTVDIDTKTAWSALKELAQRVIKGSLKLEDVKQEKDALVRKIVKGEWVSCADDDA